MLHTAPCLFRDSDSPQQLKGPEELSLRLSVQAETEVSQGEGGSDGILGAVCPPGHKGGRQRPARLLPILTELTG